MSIDLLIHSSIMRTPSQNTMEITPATPTKTDAEQYPVKAEGKPEPETKNEKTKDFYSERRPRRRRLSISSLSSDSSNDSDGEDGDIRFAGANDNDNTRIRRSKISLSTVENSSINRCTLHDSSLFHIQGAKWTKFTSTTARNIKYLKKAEIESTRIENAGTIERADIKKSDIEGCATLRRCNITESVLRGSAVVVNRGTTLERCVITDCVIYKTSFEGMVMENGIWKNGSLVGRVDKKKDVVIRALDEKQLNEFSVFKTDTNQVPEAEIQGP